MVHCESGVHATRGQNGLHWKFKETKFNDFFGYFNFVYMRKASFIQFHYLVFLYIKV